METCDNHDHYQGECLLVGWVGAVEEREGYEKREALTQQQIDVRQEEIKNINQQNRQRVAELNKAPF